MGKTIHKKRAATPYKYMTKPYITKSSTTKKRIAKLASTGIALVCLISTLFASVVYAESIGQVTLTVQQIIVNHSVYTPLNTTFTYRLVPKTDDAPMPQGGSLEDYTFTITGTAERPIGTISFNTPGIFIYELSCVTHGELGFTIDQRMYTIEIYVTSDLHVITIAYINEGDKLPDISFEHIYRSLFERPIPENNVPETMIPGVSRPIHRPPNISGVQGKPSVPDEQGRPATPEASKPAIPWERDTNDEPDMTTQPDTDGSGPRTGSSPKTGDFSNPTLWISLIVIACTLLVFLSCIGMKSKERGDR